jgi:hypothetical protein
LPEPKSAKLRPLPLILVAVGVILVLAAALAWLNRRTLAREALTGWLRSQGVAAQAQVEAFGPDTFTARLTLGDPRNPDFFAERAEVRYRARLSGVEVVSVTLRKPVLRARLVGGRLSVGSLDPLVQAFLRRPPQPDAAKPRIEVDDGALLLATDYGSLRVAADAVVDDGQLQTLAATSAPARLMGRGFDVALGAGALRVARGVPTRASLVLPITSASFGGRTLREGRLTASLAAPYPDVVRRRGEGPVALRATLTGRRLTGENQDLGGLTLAAAFDGRMTGWIQTLAVTGRGSLDFAAEAAEGGGARAGGVRARLLSNDLRWTRTGGDRVSARARVTATAAEIAVSDLLVDRAALDGHVAFASNPDDLSLSVLGRLDGRGRWTGLGAPTATDAPEMAAVKRAARAFRFEAPALQGDLVRGRGGEVRLSYRLERPLTLRPDSGGLVRVAAERGGPLHITSAGGGLPELEAKLSRLDATGADLTLNARRIGFGPLQGGQANAAGRLAFGQGALSFTATRCAQVEAQRLEFGASDVVDLAARLCPTRAPLLRLADGGWSLNARAEGVSAAAPFAQARMDGGAGMVAAQGRGDRMAVQAQVTAARLSDTAAEARFNPLTFTGPVTLSEFIWRADLAFRTPDGAPVGGALVTHDGRLGLGVAVVETETLRFAEGGLQPSDLSPAAGAVGSPAAGSARFKGRFDWAPEGAASSGVLSIPALDFTSPAGPVKGLKGEIVFESLAPLRAAPGQELTIEAVQAIVPFTGLKAQFSLKDDVLTIAGGEAAVGGGVVRVETLEAPLKPGAPVRGVLIFEGVQLHDLVEASPFGDKVELDAKVSGRVPFEKDGDRVRITGGELKAIQPGRISIDRSALTGVQADTAVAGPVAEAVPDPNATFTDFAYQAMENLAFDTLAASIASREDGRLGVLFHIVGEHDPPTRQRIRLTLMDLIQQRFLGRKLPLPSGTKVNLTLDTSLNLDDLLSDWSEYQKARTGGSGVVQP